MKKTTRMVTTILMVALMLTSGLRVRAAELTERNEYWYKTSAGFVQEQKEGTERIQIYSGIMALKQDDSGTGYAQIKVNDSLEKGYLREISYEKQEDKILLRADFETFENVIYEIEICISEYDWRTAIESQKLKAAESETVYYVPANQESTSNPEHDTDSTTQPDPVPPFGGVVDPMPPSDDIDGVHTPQPDPSPAPAPTPVPVPQPDPVPPFAGTQGPTPPSVDIDGVH